HPRLCVIMNVPDFAVAFFVPMALENGHDFSAVIEDLAYSGTVAKAILLIFRTLVVIDKLMHKYDAGQGSGLQIAFQPLKLIIGDKGVGPVKVALFVCGPRLGEVAVENNKVHAVSVEGIVGKFWINAGILHMAEELRFRDAVHVMVTQHVITRTPILREGFFNSHKEVEG